MLTLMLTSFDTVLAQSVPTCRRALQEYEEKGYTVLPLSPCLKEDILRASDVVGRFSAICNGEGCHELRECTPADRGRMQADFHDRSVLRPLAAQLNETLERERLLVYQRAYSCMAVKSIAWTNQQGLHTDWPLSKVVQRSTATVPFTALWAVLHAFELNIVPRDSALRTSAAALCVRVPRHHVIVFRGDVVHGGGTPLSQDWRLFTRYKCPFDPKHVDVHMLTPSFGPLVREPPARTLPVAAFWG